MASRGQSSWWLRLIVAVAAVWTRWQLANSDPQTNDLGMGCSNVYPQDKPNFLSRLDATMSDLRTQLSEDRRFATSEQEDSPERVYALVQCRRYLSVTDCLACYDAAASKIQNCRPSMGARLTYDGCFLRYEGYNFYKRTKENALTCGDDPAPAGFSEAGPKLLRELHLRAPKMDGKFAAGTELAINPSGGPNSTIYAVAQCLETTSQGGCQNCLTAAFETVVDCLYASQGRLTDAACFMRFSDSPFFAA